MKNSENVLSPECEKVLLDSGLYSTKLNDNSAFASIHDAEDGVWMLDVSTGISAFDLDRAINFGRRQFKRGADFGRSDMAAQLRTLIGASPKPGESKEVV